MTVSSPPVPLGRPSTAARPAARASRRWRSPASARCPMSPRRTTGTAATSSSTSGSPSASPGCASSTSPAARATAPTCSPRRRARVTGVDANPEAHEHARLRYPRPEPEVRPRRGGDVRRADCDAVSSCRRSSTSRTPTRCSSTSVAAAPGRRRLRVHAERADPRAQGRGAVGQPVARQRVPRRGVPGAVRERTSARSSYSGCSTPASCALHELALQACGWDTVHTRLRFTKPFYDRFMPAISARDFSAALRGISTARSTSSPCSGRSRSSFLVPRDRRVRRVATLPRFALQNHAESRARARRGTGDPIGPDVGPTGRIAGIDGRCSARLRASPSANPVGAETNRRVHAVAPNMRSRSPVVAQSLRRPRTQRRRQRRSAAARALRGRAGVAPRRRPAIVAAGGALAQGARRVSRARPAQRGAHGRAPRSEALGVPPTASSARARGAPSRRFQRYAAA